MMNPSGNAPGGSQQGQITEACDDHCNADLEEVPPTSRNKKNKKKVTRVKLGNFNPDEDKILVKSWLEISCDPITSNGQKKDRLWQRISDRYNSKRGSNPVRSFRSLQSRWDTIRLEVGVFASYYADSIRENPSGMSDADKTTHAAGNYAELLGKKFAFLHCWELMKDAPKWQDPIGRHNANSARGEGFGEDTTDGTETVDHQAGQSSPARAGPQAMRPMGRDAAKKKANSDAGSASFAEYAARLQDLSLQKINMMQEEGRLRKDRFDHLAAIDEKRFEEMRRHNESWVKIEEEKLRFMREQHEDAQREKEKKEDERILQIDLDACPPALRLYYQSCQEEILERQALRRRKSDGS